VRRFFASHLPATGTFVLGGEEGTHLTRVLRAREGEEVLVFDGRGREARCRIAAARKDEADLAVVEDTSPPRAMRDVLLCTAVPRGERMEWLVEKATEAGATAIVGVAAARSVRDRVGPNNLRRWRRAALEAAKQCGRADIPEVSEIVELADALARCEGRLVCVALPGSAVTLDALLATSPGPAAARVAVFIGPEGGFEPEEEAALRGAGALPFSLGSRILRIETAAAIAVHLAAR
jgi:16S rRNA (uracil1498-N3)-methyltransferase